MLENGKTKEEAESLIQEIPELAIHENQGKGIRHDPFELQLYKELFQREERYEKEHPKLNDALSYDFGFFLYLWCLAAISALYELGRTASYWLADHLDPEA